jgi:hypothetical protein
MGHNWIQLVRYKQGVKERESGVYTQDLKRL